MSGSAAHLRAPRFRIDLMSQLGDELVFAPAAARARHMDAAEQLLEDVEADGTYPWEFIVYRITGYRPERDADAILVGQPLRGDLATLVQRLSAGLALAPGYRGRTALSLEEVAQELGVSAKSVQRYRREGLVCHVVEADDGAPRLVCFADALDRFRTRSAERLARARAFTRLGPEAERRLVEAARPLAARGWSLNRAAKALARDCGRAHETVRGVLRRAEPDGAPLFDARAPLGASAGRFALRAAARGLEDTAIARHLDRPVATVRRARRRALRDRLVPFVPRNAVELPTFARDDAAAVILAAPALHDPWRETDAHDDLVALAGRTAVPLDEAVEAALVAGMHFLKRRAARRFDGLRPWPGALGLDAVVTDLRWAGLLQRRLVIGALPVALGRVEQHVGRSATTLPLEALRAAMQFAARETTAAVVRLDPSRGQHRDRVVAYALDRALAGAPPRELEGAERDGRAAARHAPGRVHIGGLLSATAPWTDAVDLEPSLQSFVPKLGRRDRTLIAAWYGFDPDDPSVRTPPRGRAELAAADDVTPAAVGRRLRAVRRTLVEGRLAALAESRD